MLELFNIYRVKHIPSVAVIAFKATDKMKIFTLLGNIIDVNSGEWVIKLSTLVKCNDGMFCEMYERVD